MDLPPNHGPDRDATILHRVVVGQYDTIDIATVTSTYDGHSAEFTVFADALKMDGVRVNVSANLQQQIADVLGCSLLTPKLVDLLWLQRNVTLLPSPQPISASTQAMVDHSARIDKMLNAQGNPTGIIQTVGKFWVLDNDLLTHPGRAMNYGWHFEGASCQGISGEITASLIKDARGQYVRLIQGRGTAHDIHHSDYSQQCILVSRACVVDGKSRDILDILADPVLAPLASHQGVLRVLRQPGVPEVPGVTTLPVITITPGPDVCT